MSRLIPICLLASAVVACVGCGGGAAPDSGAVAESSGAAAPASDGAGAAMPDGGSGMESPSGAGMPGSAGSADMNAAAYGGEGASDPASAAASMEGYGAGAGIPGADSSGGPDAAEMAAGYGAGAGGIPGAADSSTEDMAAEYAAAAAANEGSSAAGANPAGAYPGGANPAGASAPGAEGSAAYPGGEFPGGADGSGAVEAKVPDGFDGKAQLAFRRGKEKDALLYLYAHALTSDAGAQSLLPTIRLVSSLRQPKLAVRWGVGFVVTAPRNFGGDPKPVGTEQDIPTRDGNNRGGGGVKDAYTGGGGAGDYGAGGGDGGGGNNSLLKKGAGELGEKLAAAYTTRVMQGDFGAVLKTAMEARGAGNRGGGGGAEAASYGGAGGYGAGAGPGSAGGAPGGDIGNGAGGAAAAGEAAKTQVTQLMPGLSMLGIGTQKELIDRAREEEIDAIVIIDVKLRVNTSTGLVTNDSTIALLDVKTQKKLHTTKAFNNIAIQKARAEEKEDGVDKELENLFEAIDTNFKMTDLPAAMKPELVAKRVAALAAESHDNPLSTLAEIRMYHSKGLLEESALFAAYEQLLGVDAGRQLATGTEEDKKKALDRWLPGS